MEKHTVGLRFGSIAVLSVAAALASAGASQAAPPTIEVVLGTANALQVTYNGTALGSSAAPGASIPPGAYQVIVDNSIGDVGFTFHLSGPGVNLQTEVAGGEQDTETWNETLQPSSGYQFEDDTNPAATLRFFSTAASGGASSIGAAAGAGAAGSGSTSSTGGEVLEGLVEHVEDNGIASQARDADRLGQLRRSPEPRPGRQAGCDARGRPLHDPGHRPDKRGGPASSCKSRAGRLVALPPLRSSA